jgi:hypothetical protein
MEVICLDSDDEVQPVAPAPAAASSSADGSSDLEKDGFVVEKATGQVAVRDWPHVRVHCANKPFLFGSYTSFCAQCCCYVCDDTVDQCSNWDEHCKADPSQEEWRQKKRDYQAEKERENRKRKDPLVGSSRERFLTALCQVYPHELSGVPMASNVILFPYQKQALAWMYDIYNARDGDPRVGTVINSDTGEEHYIRGGIVAAEPRMGKTGIAVVSMSLFFMSRCTPANMATRQVCSVSDYKRYTDGQLSKEQPLVLDSVLFITQNALPAQLMREFQKFVPHLRVGLMFGSTGKEVESSLDRLDVVCTTYNREIPPHIYFNTVYIDEIHLVEEDKIRRKRHVKQMCEHADYVWLLTATPFAGFGCPFTMSLLGQLDNFPHTSPSAYSTDLRNRLQKILWRMEKEYKIGSNVALRVTPMTYEKVSLSMSPEEKILYDFAGCTEDSSYWVYSNGCPAYDVHTCYKNRLLACALHYKQIDYHKHSDPLLLQSLKEVTEASGPRAGHFVCEKSTRLKWMKQFVLDMSEDDGLVVFLDNAADNAFLKPIKVFLKDTNAVIVNALGEASQRQKAFQRYQDVVNKKRVLFTTFRKGSVGITLTNGNFVMLLTPPLPMDKNVLEQASKRCSGVGQTKPVKVITLFMDHTVEKSIMDYHEYDKRQDLANFAGFGGAGHMLDGNEVCDQDRQIPPPNIYDTQDGYVCRTLYREKCVRCARLIQTKLAEYTSDGVCKKEPTPSLGNLYYRFFNLHQRAQAAVNAAAQAAQAQASLPLPILTSTSTSTSSGQPSTAADSSAVGSSAAVEAGTSGISAGSSSTAVVKDE